MAITLTDRGLPKSLKVLESSYHRALKRIQKRIRNGSTIRRQARQIGLSHTALQNILVNPKGRAQRRTMIKVIRATVRPKTRRKVIHPFTGHWVKDAI